MHNERLVMALEEVDQLGVVLRCTRQGRGKRRRQALRDVMPDPNTCNDHAAACCRPAAPCMCAAAPTASFWAILAWPGMFSLC